MRRSKRSGVAAEPSQNHAPTRNRPIDRPTTSQPTSQPNDQANQRPRRDLAGSARDAAVDERRERTLGGPVSDEYDHSAYSGASSMVAPPLSIERHPFIVVRHGDGARFGGAVEEVRKGLGAIPKRLAQTFDHIKALLRRRGGSRGPTGVMVLQCRATQPTDRPGGLPWPKSVGKNALAATTLYFH